MPPDISGTEFFLFNFFHKKGGKWWKIVGKNAVYNFFATVRRHLPGHLDRFLWGHSHPTLGTLGSGQYSTASTKGAKSAEKTHFCQSAFLGVFLSPTPPWATKLELVLHRGTGGGEIPPPGIWTTPFSPFRAMVVVWEPPKDPHFSQPRQQSFAQAPGWPTTCLGSRQKKDGSSNWHLPLCAEVTNGTWKFTQHCLVTSLMAIFLEGETGHFEM